MLIGTAVGVVTAAGKAGMANPGDPRLQRGALRLLLGVQQQRQRLRGALSANTPFYNTALGLGMLFGRYWLAIPVLAIAGSLARKKTVPSRARDAAHRTRRCSWCYWSAS